MIVSSIAASSLPGFGRVYSGSAPLLSSYPARRREDTGFSFFAHRREAESLRAFIAIDGQRLTLLRGSMASLKLVRW